VKHPVYTGKKGAPNRKHWGEERRQNEQMKRMRTEKGETKIKVIKQTDKSRKEAEV
jgi:hypothetical protein